MECWDWYFLLHACKCISINESQSINPKMPKITFWGKFRFISINLSFPTQKRQFRWIYENRKNSEKNNTLWKKLKLKQWCSEHCGRSFLPFQIYNFSSKNYCRPSKIQSVSPLSCFLMTIIISTKRQKLGNLGTCFL